MPTPRLPWSKSNRSQHSVANNSSEQSSPVPSVNNEVAAQRYPPPDGQLPPPQSQISQVGPGPQLTPQERFNQQALANRPPSYRHSSNLSLDHTLPGQQYQGDQPHSPGGERPGEQPRRGSYQPQSTVYVQQEPKKHSLRSHLVAKFAGHKDDDQSRSSHKNGIGRRVSLRKGESEKYQSQLNERLQAQQWAQRQGSSPHLPTSTEEDESELDPYLQKEDHTTPQVPPKDLQYQSHPQQFVQNQQYRPPLAAVNTEGHYHGQGGVDHYSPEQHPGLQPPPPPQQQQQYQSYSPPAEQQPQHPQQYHAFSPQNAPSPIPGNAQLHHPQDLAQQPQNYYYPPPPQLQQVQQQQQQPLQSHQQDNSPYPQPRQFSPPPQSQQQPQGAEEFQHNQPGVPSGQQQPELQQPQAQRLPRLVPQNPQIDPQQQLRPPSSQQQLVPPSPIQYQAFELQPGLSPAQQQAPQPAPLQGGEDRTQEDAQLPPQQQPAPQQQQQPTQGQQGMAPSSNQPQRSTLRKVNDAGQPGPPSRQPSHVEAQQGQSQSLPQPSVTPGIPTFGANVVPPASQGQPYRGENKGSQGQGSGSMGRETPEPRTGVDMTDEEVRQLVKEHDILREKYQKVKRYFFEQQSQVHQLQNTLAHQRLSVSRTSWDDSEYATRFGRLDGLIAQLSFSIRKDWKVIPTWLHTAVNKSACETGKQEMTAVGRAFISHWLVENIFDKHFHPDLEPGMSSQLKLIQLNIRRFAPVCQNTEEEDALISKIVNWRLATLEGLAEHLKSPQGASHRQKLIETLNESLIGTLQMHLNEPAPPDLDGGVPMIVELAVNILQHLPLESRDVHIQYFPPGHSLVPEFMKIESGMIPALTDPVAEEDRASLRSVASELRESVSSSTTAQDQDNAQQSAPQNQPPSNQGAARDAVDKARNIGNILGFGKARKPGNSPQPPSVGKRESSLGQSLGQQQGGSSHSLQQPPGSSSGQKEEPTPRVRMAVGMAVEIRGRSVLIKAPVYST